MSTHDGDGNKGKAGQKGRGILASWLDSFVTHRPLMARVIGRIVRPDEVEDILQETFVHSYAAARKQQIQSPRAFMLRTARNIALNHIGSADQRLNSSLHDLDETDIASWHNTVEDEHQSNEKFLVFCRAVATLPLACRRVFILRKVYGLSQKEVAEYLGISPSTVEKHVAKGMLVTAEYMLNNGHDVGARKGKAETRSRNDGKVHG